MIARVADLYYDGQTDESLVRMFLRGNKTVFDALVVRHQDRIYNHCYRFVGQAEQARDIAQDVFIRAYYALPEFNQDSLFSTWLYRIAVNVCKNYAASAVVRHGRSTVSLEPQTESMVVSAEPEDSPLDQVIRGERDQIIQQSISALDTDSRQVVIMRDIDGLTYEEISNLTGLKLGTVKSRLARARAELAKKLKRVLNNEL